MLGGNPIDFLQAFRGRENVYFDTALTSPDTVMRFIDKIGHERVLFGSDIPFGTMEPCEIRRSMVDLPLEGPLFGVMHSRTAKVVPARVGG
jgi:hypothetical protein